MMKKILITFFVICFILFSLGVLYFYGYLRFNYPSINRYPIRGIDVSHHQGKIEWNEIKAGKIAFVYIKATEGGDLVDQEFRRNWNGASNSGLIKGAYHFFTFCTPGIEQARNFIDTVPTDPSSLPPAIDFEFIGNCKKRPEKSVLLKEIFIFIREIKEKYGKYPIIYCTYNSYEKYLKGEIGKYNIWIRDIFLQPNIPDKKSWAFWQFADHARVKGINGPVDLNVFFKEKLSDLKNM